MSETTAVIPAAAAPAVGFGFDDPESFKQIQRVAKVFTSSQLVPATFQGDANLGNVVIALNMAKRMGADPLAVMQNLYIVHGKPSWSSQFIIACLNSCGRYSPLRFTLTGEGESRTCTAWAIEKETKERLEGPPVSVAMAKREGWLGKNGSKWQTMPELMLRYRAATFFGRLYAPELMMGMGTAEEMLDVGPAPESGRVGVAVESVPAPKFAEPEPTPAPAASVEPAASVPEDLSPQGNVAAILNSGAVPFDDFRDWLTTTGLAKDGTVFGSCEDLPTDLCVDLLADGAKTLRKCVTIYGRAK